MSYPPKSVPPANAIQKRQASSKQTWFEYPIRVQPHHTDYSGVAWHGSYVLWMEEARVECLRSLGIDFSNLIALGCDLPVVELSIRYHQALPLGSTAVVRTRMENLDGVRLNWDYRIQAMDVPFDTGQDPKNLFATARVTLVAVDREKGKIMRQLPPEVRQALKPLINDV